MIIPMERRHAKEVGDLHYKYTKSLLKDIGRKLCIVFYDTVLKSEDNFGFVYVENCKVLGFAFGTVDNSRLFKHPRILLEIAIGIMKKPSIIKNLLFRLTRKYPSGPESSYSAVELDFRGKGIGKQMFLALHQEFTKRGINQLIGCIEEDNKPNFAVQQKLGARVVREFYQDGKRKYIVQIPTTLPKKSYNSH
jgi:GNAT superfamily N-acetyltransferase